MGIFLPPESSKHDQLLATVLLFLIVIYFQGFSVVLPVRSKNACGQQGFYPVKLFYTSDMPIILHSALIADLYVMPQLLYRGYSGNFLVNLLGERNESEYLGHSVPADDLAYQVWLILSQIRSMDCFMWSPCCQLVLSSQRHGLRFLVHQLRMLLSSSRSNKC